MKNMKMEKSATCGTSRQPIQREDVLAYHQPSKLLDISEIINTRAPSIMSKTRRQAEAPEVALLPSVLLPRIIEQQQATSLERRRTLVKEKRITMSGSAGVH